MILTKLDMTQINSARFNAAIKMNKAYHLPFL